MIVRYCINDFYDVVPYVIPVGEPKRVNYKMNKNGEQYEKRDPRS